MTMTQQKRLPRGSQGCGTDAAYQRHITAKERPCQACAQAHYDDQHKPDRAQARRDYDAARAHTRAEMRYRHPDEWAEIFAKERGVTSGRSDYNHARVRTDFQLKRLYPQEWQEIFDADRKKIIFDRQWREALAEFTGTSET